MSFLNCFLLYCAVTDDNTTLPKFNDFWIYTSGCKMNCNEKCLFAANLPHPVSFFTYIK